MNLFLGHYLRAAASATTVPFVRHGRTYHIERGPLDRLDRTMLAAARRVALVFANFNAIRNSPSASFASKWTLNLIQNYELPATGVLKGVAIGGSMNARGKAINGFAVDARNLLDVTKPYYAPAYATFGAWVSYKRKILRDRVDWRLQVNVRNLLDDHVLYPLSNVDTRDGKQTPTTAVYTLREPRTWQFTSAFRF